MSVALRVSAVSKRFGDTPALSEVSFQANAGEMLAVVGPNGAGKTTLLSIIAGALEPSSGSVAGPGEAPVKMGDVGWAPQQTALYSKLSAAENLRLFARLERVRDAEQAVELMLAQTGLKERADERLGKLSGGNRQRVNVAAGLLGKPPVLALDEPSTALDPGQRERLWQFVGGLARGGTCVVFSSHTVGEVERHADRLVVLDEGQLVFDGPPRALMAEAPEAADLEQALVAFLARRASR